MTPVRTISASGITSAPRADVNPSGIEQPALAFLNQLTASYPILVAKGRSMRVSGCYVSVSSDTDAIEMRTEIRLFQSAAARSFLEFETALPENDA